MSTLLYKFRANSSVDSDSGNRPLIPLITMSSDMICTEFWRTIFESIILRIFGQNSNKRLSFNWKTSSMFKNLFDFCRLQILESIENCFPTKSQNIISLLLSERAFYYRIIWQPLISSEALQLESVSPVFHPSFDDIDSRGYYSIRFSQYYKQNNGKLPKLSKPIKPIISKN